MGLIDRCKIFTGQNVVALQKEINDFLDAFQQTTGTPLRVAHVTHGMKGEHTTVITIFYYQGGADFPEPEEV